MGFDKFTEQDEAISSDESNTSQTENIDLENMKSSRLSKVGSIGEKRLSGVRN